MVTLAQVRRWARALPEVEECPHHGLSSFRVRGKIFATAPDGEHLRIMVDEHEIRATVAAHSDSCAEFYWGARLACLAVDLHRVRTAMLRELLAEAWLQKAPTPIAEAFLEGRQPHDRPIGRERSRRSR